MAPWLIVLLVVAGIVLIYFILCVFIAKSVLKQCTQPIRHTFEEAIETQQQEINVDFTDYLTKWSKQPFEVKGTQGNVSGEIVFHPDCENQKQKKVVVLCHGHTWNRLDVVKYATIFYNLGYNLVLYDHAYFGNSQGKFTTLGYLESKDLATVINHVQSVFGSNIFLGLYGVSMGAVTVLCALPLRSDISFVVADCPFSNTMNYYRELCREKVHLPSFPIVDIANVMSKRKFGYDFYETVPIECVKQSNAPICFIHGTKDKFIYPHHSKDMFAVCKNTNSELHLVEGAIHARSYNLDRNLYAKIVSEFVGKIENKKEL